MGSMNWVTKNSSYWFIPMTFIVTHDPEEPATRCSSCSSLADSIFEMHCVETLTVCHVPATAAIPVPAG